MMTLRQLETCQLETCQDGVVPGRPVCREADPRQALRWREALAVSGSRIAVGRIASVG